MGQTISHPSVESKLPVSASRKVRAVMRDVKDVEQASEPVSSQIQAGLPVPLYNPRISRTYFTGGAP